jgi:lauroyl/myristoyl acyltransferase
LSFDMSNETCFNMNEVYPTLSHLQIHKIKHSWPQLTFQLIDEFSCALINLSPNPLMKWLKDETLALISSIQSHDDPHIHCRPHLLAMP